MFGLQVLDVGLGMVFLYLLLSLICTSVTELVAGILRLRANTLIEGISNLLQNSGFEDKFYAHPLIKVLHRKGKKPSYIPAHTFTLTLLNLLSGLRPSSTIDEIRAAVNDMTDNQDLRTTMLILINDAQNDLQKLRSNIESWFNDVMDRVAGWYKTKAQIITVLAALVIAVLSNADTIQWVKSLSNDPALREALVAQAQEYAKRDQATLLVVHEDTAKARTTIGKSDASKNPPGPLDSLAQTAAGLKQNLEEIKKLGIPLGWQTFPSGSEWITKIIGLLLTALAMSLGAPFWFDLLKKIVNIRSSGGLESGPDNKTNGKSGTKQ